MTSANTHLPLPYPLYGSTLTLFRLSPLYHGSAHLLTSLNLHARRLREYLTGETLRGMPVPGNTGSTLASNTAAYGALETCTWDLLGSEDDWKKTQAGAEQGESDDEIATREPVTPRSARGVYVTLRFERAVHEAVLLGDPERKSLTKGFTAFPLMLVHMPVPVREVFVRYLETAFDVRVAQLRLRSSFMSEALERILNGIVIGDEADGVLDVEGLGKGIQLQLGFPASSPWLKYLDISIPRDDIARFRTCGKKLQQSNWQVKLPSDILPRAQSVHTGPFSTALSYYLKENMALLLDHPGLVLAKASLGPFAFSSDGKVKIIESSSLAQQVWEMLLAEASKSKLNLLEKEGVEKAPGPQTKATLKRPLESPLKAQVPADPPPPYELHDPAKRVRR